MSIYTDASLIVTPNAIKESKLFSIIPTDGSGDMDVVRATTATRVNSEGLIENVGLNIPRLDYTNGSCPSILVEPQRTNFITNSENLGNTSTTVTVARDYYNSPSNVLNADSYLINATTSPHQLFGTPVLNGFSSGQTITMSVFVKKDGNYNNVILGGTYGSSLATFNLQTGVVSDTQSNVIFASITPLANEWFRIQNTYTFTNLIGNGYLYENMYFNSVGSYLGDGVSRFGVWGFQVEVGSNATSYIPTVASAVTRNADLISNNNFVVANNSNFAVSGEFFMSTDSSDIYGRNGAIILNLKKNGIGGFSRFISIHRSTLKLQVTVKNELGFTAFFTSDENFDFQVWNKYAISYEIGIGITIALNGVLKFISNTSLPQMDLDFIDTKAYDGSNMQGKIKNIITYPSSLSNEEMIELTTL